MMKIRAMQQIAYQQALNTMYNNINQQTQNNLLRQQNNLLMMNSYRPSYYSGTITDGGFGNYRVNLQGY